jgi:hypothetical protein
MTRAQRVAERCDDAFSFDRYLSWRGCATAVLALGFNEQETEAVLRSKFTRWAADSSDKSYGYATGADLSRWMQKTYPGEKLKKEVEQLTRETFGDNYKRRGGVIVARRLVDSDAILEVRHDPEDGVVLELKCAGALHADLIGKALIDGLVSFDSRAE